MEKKDFEFTVIGRPNPFFIRLLDEYSSKHPDFEYITNNGDIDHREYVTNRGRFIAKDTGRASYLDVIRRTKITCYSTPGIDEGKKEVTVTIKLLQDCLKCCAMGVKSLGIIPTRQIPFGTIWLL